MVYPPKALLSSMQFLLLADKFAQYIFGLYVLHCIFNTILKFESAF